MIFLPIAFERYLSALRLYVQIKVLKNEKNTKYKKNLKTILFAEAVYNSNILIPTDIFYLTRSLLYAARLINIYKFKININLKDNCLLNVKPYSLLLCELVYLMSENAEITVTEYKNDIIINVNGISISKKTKRLIEVLKGNYLFENKKMLIRLPLIKTAEVPELTQNEWCYILDRFSAVNVWLNNLHCGD